MVDKLKKKKEKQPPIEMTDKTVRILSKRMSRNRGALKSLYKHSRAKTSDSLLGFLNKDVILSILESLNNIILGNVPLTRVQYNKLNRNKKHLHKINSGSTSYTKRRQRLMQSGNGLLGDILQPILGLST